MYATIEERAKAVGTDVSGYARQVLAGEGNDLRHRFLGAAAHFTQEYAWLLDVAHRHLPGGPDVVDFSSLQAAVARHTDKVKDPYPYPYPDHRATALMHQLIRVPALEYANELFAAVCAASHPTVNGAVVTVDFQEAAVLAERIARDGRTDGGPRGDQGLDVVRPTCPH